MRGGVFSTLKIEDIQMGMYTELHFNSLLVKAVPADVVEILRYMVGDSGQSPERLTNHPLFKPDTRWGHMLQCSSYYFDLDVASSMRLDDIDHQWRLCIRCNFKNYGGEIAKFLDWVSPYLDKDEGNFLGFFRYEETEEPTLIYARRRPPCEPS